jgi:transcriptional regulator
MTRVARRYDRGMYIPKHFEQQDPRTLWDFIDEHDFGTLLTVVDGGASASHVPFLMDRDAGVLHCHVARANPQWQEIERARQVLVIFTGPHGYVSPTWYAERGGVPTWNYAVVHVHGEAVAVHDAERTRKHVEAMAAKHERGRAVPWVPDYDVRRLGGIVGLDIRVSRLEGKFKLSQNRSPADRDGVVARLIASGRAEDAELARLMTAAAAKLGAAP